MTLNVLILAAGLGTRMKSEKSKVMHEILGKPILEYILNVSLSLSPSRTILLVSPKQNDIKEKFQGRGLMFAVQQKQFGTGDAVKSAVLSVEKDAELMVLAGDVPMITSETLGKLYETHMKEKNGITFLTMVLQNPKGYGRVSRKNGKIASIIEERDASEEIKKINEVNSGIYVFSYDFLSHGISMLDNNNAQKEYYLTDLVRIAHEKGIKTQTIIIEDYSEVSGINDRKQLCEIERTMLDRRISDLMESGVTIRNPLTVYIDDDVTIGADVEICSNVVLKGKTVIKEKAFIGDFSFIRNGIIESGAIIKPHTVIDK
ncbi:TPA: hypothetical protein DCW38_06435 [candidate division WOR-3 bacterium]|uniref:Nucleotidyl transferase domain-containing protein n=1 Tax=candidate division WOR-3 bacterium TaxID=2052148 RepID=A0A350HB84_UNCW3|nr:hypothetical protein [candidate division WOR-3 bacterium]